MYISIDGETKKPEASRALVKINLRDKTRHVINLGAVPVSVKAATAVIGMADLKPPIPLVLYFSV